MLVNIYGSKSLFVKEYRKLLSDRLLLNQHFDTEEEIRNLEFLKIRFGESELHNCEVMLKDVADSKRINTHLQSAPDQPEVRKFACIVPYSTHQLTVKPSYKVPHSGPGSVRPVLGSIKGQAYEASGSNF